MIANTAAAEPWRRALLPLEATLHHAVRNLNETALQIALVVTPEGILVGTITDGDIRRGLLRGLDLSSPIASVVRREPLVVPPDMTRDMVLQLMRANGVAAIPVVDEARNLVGLHLLKELLTPTERPNVMVIMAGGQGSRLKHRTENCPKPLLPVAGKPMMEHILERAKAEGFRRFVVAVHYLAHMIEEYFGDGSKWQVEITYLRENSPLGTAGALGLLTPRPDAAFLVSNADVLTDIRYAELLDFHSRHRAIATMGVRLHEWQHPFGVVHIRGVDIVAFEEKPTARSHINAGVYALDPPALDVISAGEHCNMPTLFARLQERNARTIVYPMHEPWLDVGHPDDYDAANGEL